MSDVTVTLNNTEIATLDDTGIARLKTSGKRMDGDVLVQYEKPQSGPDVSGLDAEASDVASGKKFIGSGGEEETGIVYTISGENGVLVTGDHDSPSAPVEMSSWSGGNTEQSLFMGTFVKDVLVRGGADFWFLINKSRFGNATTSDVAAGKTFSGVDGIMQTGTAPGVIYNEYVPTSRVSSFTVEVGTTIAPRITCIMWWAEHSVLSQYPILGITPCYTLMGTTNGYKIYKGATVEGTTTSTSTSGTYHFGQASGVYASYSTGINESAGVVRIGTNWSSSYFEKNYVYKYAILYI